ncbi:amino acid adenylation domain-containing protein [Pseudosulfitobacter sp. DSM 107133]|uniref:amino acid adenylation domain-containing protein n=1 Tax=Pseudosulfitobacter sp. DSM 107133 TaxID=2883100 RepID=UPI0013B3F3EF|nr:amino acid adenylation domain-containing protein [Pseudosulfitobacter sp. DSM 107133]UOA29258.1 Dimodular nonribosomal peptide synthase [Pseudosulfitobacter sp. DSM 107133]
MSKDFITPTAQPLTPLERRIYAHDHVGELAPFAYETLILGFDHRFARAGLVTAINDVLAQHPAFTAAFVTHAGGAVERHDTGQTGLVVHQAGDLDRARAHAATHAPDLAGHPACADLWPDGSAGHILTLVLHPVLGDDATFASIEAALWGALALRPAPDVTSAPAADNPPLNARTQWRELMNSHQIARLPHRYVAPEQGLPTVKRITRQITIPEQVGSLVAPTDIAAALGIVLRRYGAQDALRFAVALPPQAAERRSTDLRPLCLSPDLTAPFGDTVALTARALHAAPPVPSETLIQDQLAHADADPHPLGAIALYLRANRALPAGVCHHHRPMPPSAEELVLTAQSTPQGIELHADADAALFEPALIERFLRHLQRVLHAGLHQPDLPVGHIPLLDDAELATLSAPYPDDTPVDPRATHEIIAAHALTTPDKIAIISGADRLTHATLDARANALAHRLCAAGVGAETPVAILIERGADAIVAILAVLKAGGAYIPVEPDHPSSRNHHILTDAGVAVVLTRSHFRDRLPDALAARIICLDDLDDAPRPDAPEVTIHPDQLAYVMYTSGSTGKPKGVAVEHGPLSHHNQTTARVYEMSAESRELPFLPFSSDGGHERWMVPLMMGGSVVVPDGPLWTPEQTLGAMREHGCNNASIPTTYLQQLAEWAEDTGTAPPMRLYSFGGEGLAQSTFDLLSRALNAQTLINGYGPTETIMTPMVWKVAAGTRFQGTYAPLGRAVGDRRVYVLDEDMMPCPQGVVGEIYLGGTGVARGYVGQPQVTADRFIPDPFGPALDGTSGARLYRTGDQGRWREDGTVEFVGRVDLQIKINGYRIEPGEIEAALLGEPDVTEALVLLREDGGAKRLIGYVTGPAPGAGDALRRALESKLPKHMLPEAVVVLDKMPTNPNAKLDRAALPLPEARSRQTQGVAPASTAEQQVLTLWRDLLTLPDLGVTDDFFAMGGSSLLALKAIAGMRKLWPEVPLTVADFFDAPTVRGFCTRMTQGGQTGRAAITLRAGGTKPRLYCFPGLLVSTREYLRLTDYLGPDQPVTGFLCHSLNENKQLNVSVADVVAEYVDHIRRESAGAPVAFLGWSWGGLLAWEAARQLQHEVDLKLLGMVDVCDLGTDFTPGATPVFAPGERARLEDDLQAWLARTQMRAQWDQLIGAMDAECYAQFLRFIGNESDPLPYDGPEISSREHTFWVLIDNALVFRQHRLTRLDVPVASFSAGDSLSRGLNLMDWRKWSARATPAEIVSGTNHLHIIGDPAFHDRFRARLNAAFAMG